MNPFGWKKWKELPYRGDGESKNYKRKRRFVDLRRERRGIVKTVLGAIILFAIVFGCFVTHPTITYDNSIKIIVVVIGLILLLIFVAGIMSLNKFRRGYDVDVSNEEDKDNSANT